MPHDALNSTGPLRVRAALFDLDGTLIATRRLYIEALADALEPLLGRRFSEADIMRHKPRAERRFLADMVEEHQAAAVLERFYASYEASHDRHFEGLYTGVTELLDALRRRPLPMGLVTGKSRRAWEITSSRVRLGTFGVHVFDDDVPAPKPDPTGLHLALEALDADPAEVVYVGDSLTDLEAARAAGMASVAVLWSKKAEEVDRFRSESMDRGARIAPTPHALLELLE